MLIETKAISKKTLDKTNVNILLSAVNKMIEEGKEKIEIKLSLNLLDPDRYSFEYAPDDRMLSIVRKGTSLTGDLLLGATGLVSTDTYAGVEEAVKNILGINRVELSTIDSTLWKRSISVSKGWHMLQEEDEDIYMKAFADVNASDVRSTEKGLGVKIRQLADIQCYIRECKTLHPDFDCTANLTDDLESILITFNGKEIGIYDNADNATSIVQALTTGYKGGRADGQN